MSRRRCYTRVRAEENIRHGAQPSFGAGGHVARRSIRGSGWVSSLLLPGGGPRVESWPGGVLVVGLVFPLPVLHHGDAGGHQARGASMRAPGPAPIAYRRSFRPDLFPGQLALIMLLAGHADGHAAFKLWIAACRRPRGPIRHRRPRAILASRGPILLNMIKPCRLGWEQVLTAGLAAWILSTTSAGQRPLYAERVRAYTRRRTGLRKAPGRHGPTSHGADPKMPAGRVGAATTGGAGLSSAETLNDSCWLPCWHGTDREPRPASLPQQLTGRGQLLGL